ncbi:type I phosphodiesterase/nucleotide pyrophosphatase [Branchiibius hedensis]|uniref:Type I phosphodiesterase / nucleotide pyrophosphatase n=1 Tax=Branchiibius hedensis TaxID=672460 RepID=A0A2Y8ZV00_9MICO|nr:nucleotide pyrophosphatase/phosphodiesterase family protein [Branchiibius hedensis]PWJ24891.1 type I phosphodiesterase/nucleotide pyrophosphatase [Branchiibius hedensis]SSA33707.1 Type I phosphodiesterase / nucleotide pyrophosphatase [Branchiibius hedensis]
MSAVPPVPGYDGNDLAGVLPRVVASLGVRHSPYAEMLPALEPARSAVVVLVDGLGLELLRARSGHAPYLRSLLASSPAQRGTAGFPSTTATSMGTFGTGLPPGRHGLVGYVVRDPARDVLFNELDWIDGPNSLTWQPNPTAFEIAGRDGVDVTMVGADYFDGSGLTRAALRGARVLSAYRLADRVDLALAALRGKGRQLIYLYWGDIDRIGHTSGCGSLQWVEELERVDAELSRLARALPAGVSLTVTADHGMVDVPFADRIDLAADADLVAGIHLTGGEPRALQLYTVPGAADDVAATWRERFADDAWVLTRDEAIAAGLFGATAAGVDERIGDVLVAMRSTACVYDSRTIKPVLLELVGQHGSLTDAELLVPVLHAPAS